MPEIPRRRVLGGTAGLAFALAGWGAGDGRANEPNIADSVVTSTAELEATFRNLSPGETVLIAGKNAPYRTTGWLDIDVDDVTVVGPGVRTLIKPAADANCGGFRIGHHRRCENITIRGVGFDGNPEEQNIFTKLRHDIIVDDAENSSRKLRDAHPPVPRTQHGRERHQRRTGEPGRSHGGNGFSPSATWELRSAGDHRRLRKRLRTSAAARLCIWRRVRHRQGNTSPSSDLAGRQPAGHSDRHRRRHTQGDGGDVDLDNRGFGHHKSFCHLGFDGTTHAVRIDGNVSAQERRDNYSGISLDIAHANHITAVNNDLYGYGGRGINITDGISDFVVARNRIHNVASDGIRVAGARDGVVSRNTISETGRTGIMLADARFVTVEGNRLKNLDRIGLVAAGGETNHEIVGNQIREFAAGKGHEAGMLVQSDGNLVQRNRIYRSGGPGIVEGSGSNNWMTELVRREATVAHLQSRRASATTPRRSTFTAACPSMGRATRRWCSKSPTHNARNSRSDASAAGFGAWTIERRRAERSTACDFAANSPGSKIDLFVESV